MTQNEKYDQMQAIEHELLNRRITWLLSSQSILFAALAFVIGNNENFNQSKKFFQVISFLGISVSLLIWIGVIMGLIAKFTSWQDYKNIVNRELLSHQEVTEGLILSVKPNLGVRTWITFIAVIPEFFLPFVFVLGWYFLIFK